MRRHPFCYTCGWRMGGIDSWDGKTCKCGYSAPPIPDALSAPCVKPMLHRRPVPNPRRRAPWHNR